MEERTLVSFDYAVKYLLRDKSDFVILSGFLTELLGRKVEVKAIIESENNIVDPAEKTSRVDLKAEIDDGELAVFEFQFHQQADFFGRVLFGVSNAIIEQVKRGGMYGIKKVYSINVAYYNLNAKREYLFFGKFEGFNGVHFKNETVPFVASNKSETDIQPEYYLILPKMFDEQLRDKFDEWVYVLKHSAVRDDFTATGIEAAKVKLDLLNMSPEDRKIYEKYEDNKASLNCAIQTAKQEGIQEGEQKGKQEMAKNLIRAGVDINIISKSSGLTIEEIEFLNT